MPCIHKHWIPKSDSRDDLPLVRQRLVVFHRSNDTIHQRNQTTQTQVTCASYIHISHHIPKKPKTTPAQAKSESRNWHAKSKEKKNRAKKRWFEFRSFQNAPTCLQSFPIINYTSISIPVSGARCLLCIVLVDNIYWSEFHAGRPQNCTAHDTIVHYSKRTEVEG